MSCSAPLHFLYLCSAISRICRVVVAQIPFTRESKNSLANPQPASFLLAGAFARRLLVPSLLRRSPLALYVLSFLIKSFGPVHTCIFVLPNVTVKCCYNKLKTPLLLAPVRTCFINCFTDHYYSRCLRVRTFTIN